MKNKTKTYILLVAVLGIWGTIAYKMISGLNPKSIPVAEVILDTSFKPKMNIKADTFSIQEVARDPFLGTLATKQKQTPKTVGKKKANSIQPRVSYNGLVRKQKSKQQIFVVNIEAQQYLMKKGDVYDSVKLLSGNAKEIRILYKGRTTNIPIKND